MAIDALEGLKLLPGRTVPDTRQLVLAADENGEDDSLLNAKALAGLKMRSIGPALMSGRVSDIATHPTDPGTWYVAVGSGGVWKTVNSGTTWILPTPSLRERRCMSSRA